MSASARDHGLPDPATELRVVILGLSITSSWGNGHATNFRALVRALTDRGHDVLFLERDVPWYRENRDLPDPPWGELALYGSVDELRERFRDQVRDADVVVVGSYVPDGVEVGHWVADTAEGVAAFYDIDTPVTLGKLEEGDHEYLEPGLIPRYDLYLSFTGGPVLEALEQRWGSPAARPFYCLVDPDRYRPRDASPEWDLGYLGTYSPDRQPAVERLLLEPARRVPAHRFAVAGPEYPEDIEWPANVERFDHIPPSRHRVFYTDQRFTLNVTRERMIRAGWSPSVRLFEAAACAVPVISDRWQGLDRFFTPGREILICDDTEDVLRALRDIDASMARRMGQRARERILAEHTAAHRAAQLEDLVLEARERRPSRDRPGAHVVAPHGGSPEAGEASPAPSGEELTAVAAGREAGMASAGLASSGGGRTASPGSSGDRRTSHPSGAPLGPYTADPAATAQTRKDVARLGPWFHNLHLPDGVQTAPDHALGDFPKNKWRIIAPHLPLDLEGWSVLDIGCNAGFYSIELARRGARVVGVDHGDRYLDQARWAAEQFRVADRIEFRKQDVYELGRSNEQYDIVLFMGVLYHLRYPLLGLDIAARLARRTIVVQSLMMWEEPRMETTGYGMETRHVLQAPGWPRMAFVEHEFEGDPTNWWIPDPACLEAMMRSAGLTIVDRPGRETYLCRPSGEGTFSSEDELRTALGRP